jgi:(p)ppGpp synthase/HD superfamily hydrolase
VIRAVMMRELIGATRPDADLGLIQRAYEVAAAWHQGQVRKIGDPYLTHPVAVAKILAGLGAHDQMLCAALLHSAIRTSPCTLTELSRDFGADIETLVAAVDALKRIRTGTECVRARAMAAVQSAAPRAQAVKFAPWLHHMRTLEFAPQDKQLRKAREALEFFAPMAASVRTIESELKALASATLQRHRYTGSASGRLLTLMTTILPTSAQIRWRDEWLGEFHTLPTRRAVARFALHTMLGVPRLAVTLRRPPPARQTSQLPGGQAGQ